MEAGAQLGSGSNGSVHEVVLRFAGKIAHEHPDAQEELRNEAAVSESVDSPHVATAVAWMERDPGEDAKPQPPALLYEIADCCLHDKIECVAF